MPKKNVQASNNATKVVNTPVATAALAPTTVTKYCSKCQGMMEFKDGVCTICSNKLKVVNEEAMRKQDEETTKRMSVSQAIASIKDEDEEDDNDDPSPSDLEREDKRRVERVIYPTKEECIANPLQSTRLKKKDGKSAQQPHEVTIDGKNHGWVWAPNGELAIAYVCRQVYPNTHATTGNKKGFSKEAYEKKVEEEATKKAQEKMATDYANLQPHIRDIILPTLSEELRKMVWEKVNGKKD